MTTTTASEEHADRLHLLLASEEFNQLKSEGLALLNLKREVPEEEFNELMKDAWQNEEYLEWRARLESVAHSCGVGEWIAELAVFVADFSPGVYPIRSRFPVARLIAHTDDVEFLNAFAFHAHSVAAELGLTSIQLSYISGGRETHLLKPLLSFESEPDQPSVESRPPRDDAIGVCPIFAPSISARERSSLSQQAHEVSREITRRLGYELPQRVRSSKHRLKPLC